MRNNFRLKLTFLTFLLIIGGTAYSSTVPTIKAGTQPDSVIAGDDNGQTASAEKSLAFGHGNKAEGKYSSAFGYTNTTKEEYDAAFGTKNEVTKKKSSAFGVINKVEGENSTVIGTEYNVTGNASGAFGVGTYNGSYQYKNEGNNSYMIGNKNKIAIGSDDNFILGNEVSIGKGITNSVALGSKSTVSKSNEVSVGSKDNKRKITNVANGTISDDSTDAVNGKQLHEVMQNSNSNNEKLKKEVNTEINNIRNEVNTQSDKVKSEVNTEINNIRNEVNTQSDKVKSEVNTEINNIRNEVNTQSDKVKSEVNKEINNIRNEVNTQIDDVKNEVKGVGSLSAALAGLHPMQYDPKAPTQVMASVGHYKNKESVAVGASYYFNDSFMMSTGIALSGDKKAKTMANVGFTLKLGKGSGYTENSQFVASNDVNRLTVENQNLKTEINILNSKNKEQDEKIKRLEEKLDSLLKNK